MMAEFSIKFTLPDNQKTPAQLRVVTGVFIPGSLLFLDVKNQAVINQLIAHFFNDLLLPLLNFFVVKLEHLARVYTYDVVDRKSTRLNSSHVRISYAVFCLKKKTN